MSVKRSENAAYSEIGKNQSAAFNWKSSKPTGGQGMTQQKGNSGRLEQDAQNLLLLEHSRVKGCQGITEFKHKKSIHPKYTHTKLHTIKDMYHLYVQQQNSFCKEFQSNGYQPLKCMGLYRKKEI